MASATMTPASLQRNNAEIRRRKRNPAWASIVLGNAHQTVIPGGKYAALSFKGVVSEFEPAWAALLRDWLPSSGLQLDSRPMFEYYLPARATIQRPEYSNANCASPWSRCEVLKS